MAILDNKHPAPPRSVLQFIWGAYLRSALVPILLIELVLIAAYIITNEVTREQNLATLERLATEQLMTTAQQQAALIGQQLALAARGVDVLRRQAQRALRTPYVPDAAERARYALSPEGALYTTQGLPGRAAMLYSNRVRIGEAEQARALQFSQIDPVLAALQDDQSLTVQSYVLTRDSMIRVYPYFDILKRLPPDMDVTRHNFFYEADANHNPHHQIVWTDVYLDPAGRGWVASVLAPVYQEGGSLPEAVAGMDITVERFIAQVRELHIPWNGYGVLVDKHGTLLALPSRGEQELGLKELTHTTYEDIVKQDTFKPDAFNLLKRADHHSFGAKIMFDEQGQDTVVLSGQRKQVAWSTVEGTGWKLLILVDQAQVFAKANDLNSRFNRIGLSMLAALVAFYLLFFTWLYRKVRRLSVSLADPLLDLEAMMQRIAQKQYVQPVPTYPIAELQHTGEGLVQMGKSLEQSNRSLEEAQRSLEQLNLELEERIRLRTGELQEANRALHREIAAKQALIHEMLRIQAQMIQSEKLASLGQLVAGIAHEIRNPLNFINNMAEVVLERATELGQNLATIPEACSSPIQESIEDLKQSAAIIDQHGRRASRIIQSMMEHARGGAGTFHAIDVNRLVEQALRVSYLRGLGHESGRQVALERELDPKAGQIQVSPEELVRVLENLLQNARFAVLERQRISTATYTPTIRIRTSCASDKVMIVVEDNGSGIPREILPRIFEPFFTTKPPGEGNIGLGLSLSHDIIVKMHGGQLTVESEPDRYTRFTISLPKDPSVGTASGRVSDDL
ncbi:ATP-binding protein [Cystobacter fuscus]|uniref:ATP-binding protein n=1 Tax=Cystobacter fuscus TaxID=43 RepID=UPI0037C05D02